MRGRRSETGNKFRIPFPNFTFEEDFPADCPHRMDFYLFEIQVKSEIQLKIKEQVPPDADDL